MGQVCSVECSKNDDSFKQIRSTRQSIKHIRTSIKKLGPESTQTSFASSRNDTDQFNFKSVFNGNLKKITEMEMLLSNQRTKILDYANRFMTYIALVEHPLNDFNSMDQRIFEGIIKPKVLKMIKNDVQGLFEQIEQNLQSEASLI